jgi:peptidoglycan/xylan/chitin deacetylase (PgdA/CDA1 family)
MLSKQNTNTTIAVHVDCDPLWVYESELGLPTSEHQDLIYRQALPAMLEIFSRWNIRATFFVIGRELERQSCVDFCRAAVAQGHRLANHSFSHAIEFARLPVAAKRDEIAAAGRAIQDATGEKPIGFRAPGYCADKDLLPALRDAGYLYDSSVLPGPTGLLVKTYMTLIGRGQNGKSYGPWTSLFARQNAHRMRPNPGAQLWRYPIATFPWLRLPIHSTFAFLLGEAYLAAALRILRRTRGHHVYLLHAIDTLRTPHPNMFDGHVIPLRFTLEERCALLHRLGALVQGHVVLTEDLVQQLREQTPGQQAREVHMAATEPPTI